VTVVVTGADGFVGRSLVPALVSAGLELTALDVREVPAARRLPGVAYRQIDIRDPALGAELEDAHTVVHLASIVTPTPGMTRQFMHEVDVGGTRKLLAACLERGVKHLIVSSSGAAYGYHADHPAWIDEDQPLRGNTSFAYADHKRQVEELLADARRHHPELRQTVFRIGTILGETVDNQITALWERPRLLAVRGHASPFVFIWDEDVVGALLHAVLQRGPADCWNLAGDGALTVHDIAQRLGKPVIDVPAALLTAGLTVGHALRLTRYGPEQLDFLRYRPVLDNTRLKRDFGYVPTLSSAAAFDRFVRARSAQGRPLT
jgi:UDP-glucose 4-epimerase